MRLFVTGGTGFIGSNFINHAHNMGHEVVASKRNPNSIPRVELETEPTWIISELDQIDVSFLDNVDAIVHLAAFSVHPPYESIENCMNENLIKPIKFFKKAIDKGITNFIVSGSCFEYGNSGERFDFIPVTAPLEPTLSYSASKAAASIAFYQMSVEFKLRMQIFRIFHVYGHGESQNRFWPSLKFAAETGKDFDMTLGQQWRDFVDVNSVVESLLEACISSELIEAGKPQIKNLGSGKPMTLKEFAEKNWKLWNAKGKLNIGALQYRQGEVMRYVPELNQK